MEIHWNTSVRSHAQRNGMVLWVVLVLLAALSLAAYTFSHSMTTHVVVHRSQQRQLTQRLLAESAMAELLHQMDQGRVRSTLASHGSTAIPPAPLAFGNATPEIQRMMLPHAEEGYYAILSHPPSQGSYHFGIANESAKLNLNSLTDSRFTREKVIQMLMQTPKMTQSIAEGIADRLGLRSFDRMASEGSITPPSTSQAPPTFQDFHELLAIPGISSELLFGEDRNANGWLDPQEDDGDLLSPHDNQDGRLDRGWLTYWTLDGAESTLRADGTPKIQLNSDNLALLYDQLLPPFGPEVAKFVIAWKLGIPTYPDERVSPEDRQKEDRDERFRTLEERLRSQLGQDQPPNTGSPDRQQSFAPQISPKDQVRAGIALREGTGRELKSVFDLVGCQVQIAVEGKDSVLISPLSPDAASAAKWLPQWERETTLSAASTHRGRININQAPLPVLKMIDGMTDGLAQAIVQARDHASSDSPTASEFDSIAWLLARGLVTSSQLRKLAPQMTVGGDVGQGFAVGQLVHSPTSTVLVFSIDGRMRPARIRFTYPVPFHIPLTK